MTQKEKLYKELTLITNKLHRLTGKPLMNESDEYFSSAAFSYLARSKKIEELKSDIQWMEDAYNFKMKKLKIEEYYNTEEGKKHKIKLENKCNTLYEKRRENVIETNGSLSLFIKSWLGSEWGIGNANKYSVEIGLVKRIVDGYTYFHFGCSFTLSYGNMLEGKKKFDLNYGSMGEFELFGEDNTRQQFLLGLGNFVSNKEKLTELRSILWKYVDKLTNIDRQIWNIEWELEDPFENKEVA